MRDLFNISNVARGMQAALVAMITMIAVAMPTACSKDETTDSEGYTQGVILPSESTRTCSMSSSNIDVSITTQAGYTITTSNTEMISFISGNSAANAGKHLLSMKVNANMNEKSRSAIIYITVEGYERTPLLTVKQDAFALHPLVEWVDGRLTEIYYWLDEYIEKRSTFDFTLPYDEFLDASLKSLTTNHDDGKVYEDGSRSLYSYVDKINMANVDDEGNIREETMGFGISITPLLMRYDQTNLCMNIEHVYPGSVADKAGLKRGDTILKINGENLSANDIGRINELFVMVQYNSTTTLSLDYIQVTNSQAVMKHADLTADYFIENPVAYCDVLTIPEQWYEKEGVDKSRKVGYISYLQFEFNHEKRLVEAMQHLSNKGVTDLIIDVRSNPGGDIRSCISLASMAVGEGHVGQPFMQLTYNPKRGKEPTVYNILKNGYEEADMGIVDLPNLNMQKVYIIASNQSSSASEALIVGLIDLGIDVVMVGLTTDGKNCGMETQVVTYQDQYYMIAPISFMNASGKGFHDYGNGIKPGTICQGVNFDDYASDDDTNSVGTACRRFPIPESAWGDVGNDIALAECVAQIFGYTIIKSNQTDSATSLSFKGVSQSSQTRSGKHIFEPTGHRLKTRFVGSHIPTELPTKVLAE